MKQISGIPRDPTNNVNRTNTIRRQIPGLNPGQAVETTKLEYGRGRGNFRWSGEMRRDRKELLFYAILNILK
ncbi:hypothetical protein DCAR_0206500 [Daucus carota subsp. sativus]|uniref:Uncharacterized protein n=1 Tax=Daucus carota subsp. sativus TaxID=79200 RepID=A0AAF0WCA4_DAUCS|nr:hypothetical protein DCAR_0206500 [Daucus carota subsp. sativus]